MITQTNSTEPARNSRNQPYCFGTKKHRNHNPTGSRRNFGKIQNIYTKEKLKYGKMK